MKCSIKNCQSEATSWSKSKGFCSIHSPFQKHRPKKIGGYVRSLKIIKRKKGTAHKKILQTHKCSTPKGILKVLRGSNPTTKTGVEDEL